MTLGVSAPRFAWLALVPLVSACAMLGPLPGMENPPAAALTPPTITFQGATLARTPSQAQLAAYYCPELVSVPFGGAAILCQGFFGPRPPVSDMAVSFDLKFHVQNPNGVPIPLASVLTAVTVFPAATNQRLGAACMQLCPEGTPGCTGQPAPGACEASSRDVRSLNDFKYAAANLLMAAGLAAASGQPPSFTAPRVSAASEMDVTVRFSLGPDELLAAAKQLATQSVDQLRAGQALTLAVPYRLEGTVFFDAGSLGRIAVGFGPTDGVWNLG
jgi:hypothetical protein